MTGSLHRDAAEAGGWPDHVSASRPHGDANTRVRYVLRLMAAGDPTATLVSTSTGGRPMTVQTALQDLAELSRYHAAVRGERVAMKFEGRETTFGQLDRRASRVANGLLAACSGPQARIAVLDKSSDMFYELLFGAAKARAVL